MFSTSRKLLGSLTLFTFIFAFAIPLLVMIESAKAGPECNIRSRPYDVLRLSLS